MVQMPMEQDVTENYGFEPQSLELGERIVSQTGARAPCPSTQSDGGFNAGDAPGNNTTSLSFGSDPSTAARLPGCVDTTDTLDFYMVNLTAGNDFTFELTVPTGADFDLYLLDTSSTILQSSEYNDPLESFVHITNSSNAGTYYVVVSQYSSDGGYYMEMWTNSSSARPDLTVSSVSGPSAATTGGTATVSYTVNNIGAGALNSTTPYDIPIILSTDTTYDSADTILNTQITGPNLASGTSQIMSSNVTIPSSLSAGTYYWIVWADGWGNVTESDELNNNNVSSSTTSITIPGGVTGDVFEPNENTTTATAISTLPFSYSNLSIHTTTDDDYFAIPMISGVTYWINNTHTYANGDLDMDLMQGSIMLGSGATSSDNESITHTASGNFTAHLYIYGWLSATNTYGLSIESSATPSPPRNESIYVYMNNNTESEAWLYGLTSGTSYSVNWELYWQNGTTWQMTGQLWENFTATSSTEQQNVSTTLYEGDFCIYAELYDNTGSTPLYLDMDGDCDYIEMLEASVTSDTGGEYTAQNLTVGDTYSIQWWLLEGTLGSGNISTIDYGVTQNFTATQTTLFSNVYWTLPSNSTQHTFLVRLYDSNGPSATSWIGAHVDYFTPTLPDVTITQATNYNSSVSSQNFVTSSWTNLSMGDIYEYILWVDYYPNYPYSVNMTNHHYTGYNNYTAGGTGATWNVTYSTPGTSGVYCVYSGLYEWNLFGSVLLDYDETCFTIVYDDDLDGVWNENDNCPNTPTNATVDAFGCAAVQRDSDGDGYNDAIDAFPFDATQWSDADGDGYGDNPNGNMPDAFPNDASQWADSDGDGFGDNANGTTPDACPNIPGTSVWDRYGCPDYDGDGWSDDGDDFIYDSTQWSDADGDGYGDNPQGNMSDAFPNDPTQWQDADGDGYGDNPQGSYPDAFPTDASQWSDTDGDGYGDNPQGNNPDAFPTDASQWSDADGDGYGDNSQGNNPDHCPNSPPGAIVDSTGCAASERDTDGDGVMDADDNCVNVDASGWDTDQDGCIDDTDNDGVLDPDDDCRLIDATGYDNDGDGCIDDTDGDNVNDANDACIFENASGWDTDGNGCIDDSDGDTIKDDVDQCRNIDSTGFDADGDGCIDDSDNDNIPDNVDQCRYASSLGYDNDGDGCIDDTDGDLVLDNTDACVTENATGYDVDGDGCIDDTDGDGVKDTLDDCTEDASGFDNDGDGCIDDTDGDSIKDNVDACVAEDATGFDNDGNGCIDDTDGDSVKDNTDACVTEDATGFDNDGDGCIDDTDGDSIKDNVDVCVEEDATGFDSDGNGCIDDTDGDGVKDDTDACEGHNDNIDVDEDGIPDGCDDLLDNDGDGVANDDDFYPMDASRSAEEGGLSMPFWIALAIVVFIGIGGTAIFLMRRMGGDEEDQYAGGFTMDPQPAEDLYAMAGVDEGTFAEAPQDELLVFAPPAHATTNEHGQTTWADESGVSWCQDPDGSLSRYDAESGAWVPHQ